MPKDQHEGCDESAEPEARFFVNDMAVSLSLSTVNFDLGTKGEDTEATWRFTTTPARFSDFHAQTNAAIEAYRNRYGDIRADGETSSIGQHDDEDPADG
ncbi:MAG: hypothetical protein AAF583_00625 [Pseudomonadota bacterium]